MKSDELKKMWLEIQTKNVIDKKVISNSYYLECCSIMLDAFLKKRALEKDEIEFLTEVITNKLKPMIKSRPIMT